MSTAAVALPPGERARRRLPLIDVSRKQAFSTRACYSSADGHLSEEGHRCLAAFLTEPVP